MIFMLLKGEYSSTWINSLWRERGKAFRQINRIECVPPRMCHEGPTCDIDCQWSRSRSQAYRDDSWDLCYRSIYLWYVLDIAWMHQFWNSPMPCLAWVLQFLSHFMKLLDKSIYLCLLVLCVRLSLYCIDFDQFYRSDATWDCGFNNAERIHNCSVTTLL